MPKTICAFCGNEYEVDLNVKKFECFACAHERCKRAEAAERRRRERTERKRARPMSDDPSGGSCFNNGPPRKRRLTQFESK